MMLFKKELEAAMITDTAKLMLLARGYRVWRQNNLTVRRRKGIVTLGVSDIIGYHKRTGVFIACEVKKIGDVFSPKQIEFLQEVHAAGGVALYATEEKGTVVLKEFSEFIIKPKKQKK